MSEHINNHSQRQEVPVSQEQSPLRALEGEKRLMDA
jgi:hypothetical protein